MKALKRVLVVMCSSAGQSSFSSFIFGFVHQTPHTHIYYLIHIHHYFPRQRKRVCEMSTAASIQIQTERRKGICGKEKRENVCIWDNNRE